MPSVKGRIEKFEALSKKENVHPSIDDASPQKGHVKRFKQPGEATKVEGASSTLEQLIRPPSRTSRSHGLSTFEHDLLEDVWSVKRNIGINISRPSEFSKIGPQTSQQALYSRHTTVNGAVASAALPAGHTKQIGTARSTSFLKKNNVPNDPEAPPLRDQNCSSESGKRTLRSANKDVPPPPKAKRKTFNFDLQLPKDSSDKKLSYAEKMAAAHRKSSGLGEFALKQNNSYRKEKQVAGNGHRTKWIANDGDSIDDEFDF